MKKLKKINVKASGKKHSDKNREKAQKIFDQLFKDLLKEVPDLGNKMIYNEAKGDPTKILAELKNVHYKNFKEENYNKVSDKGKTKIEAIGELIDIAIKNHSKLYTPLKAKSIGQIMKMKLKRANPVKLIKKIPKALGIMK